MLKTPILSVVTSTLTRPNNTTAYTAGSLIANDTTAANVVLPSFKLPEPGATRFTLQFCTLYSDGIGAGIATQEFQLWFWNKPPVFGVGDGGTFNGSAITSGMAGFIGMTGAPAAAADGDVFGDGIVMSGDMSYATAGLGDEIDAGASIYWMLVASANTAGGFTPLANQKFTARFGLYQQ